MNEKEAFQYGFRMHCATEGCDEAQTRQRAVQAIRMIKSAEGPWSALKDVGGLGLSALKAVADYALPLAVLGPPVAGIGAGYLAARALDNPYDINEARMNELLAEYRHAIASMKQHSSDAQPAHLV